MKYDFKSKGERLKDIQIKTGKPENKPRHTILQNKMGISLGISRLVIVPTRPFFAVQT